MPPIEGVADGVFACTVASELSKGAGSVWAPIWQIARIAKRERQIVVRKEVE